MNLSKIMGSMTLRERRMLNEAVKQRIVEEESSATAAPAAPPPATEPSEASPIGSTLSKDGKVVFELTAEGWKTTLRISEEQILALVIPAVQEELKKQMRAAKGQGDELHIVKSSLTDPGAANKSNELFLKRDGEEFADPVVIPIDKMKKMQEYKLTYKVGNGMSWSGTDAAADATARADRRGFVWHAAIDAKDNFEYEQKIHMIGAAKIVANNARKQAKMSVPSSDFTGFDDLFGTNAGKVASAIQKAAGSKKLASFKIPLSWAEDNSAIKFMSDSILRGVGIGKIEFKLTADNMYVATVSLSSAEIKALNEKLAANKAANDDANDAGS